MKEKLPELLAIKSVLDKRVDYWQECTRESLFDGVPAEYEKHQKECELLVSIQKQIDSIVDELVDF